MPTWSSSVGAYGNYRFEFQVELHAQDVGANRSTVWFEVRMVRTGGSQGTYGTRSWNGSIDGMGIGNTAYRDFRPSGARIVLQNGYKDVYHRADGTQNFGFDAHWPHVTTGMQATSVYGNWELPRIPRTSDFSFNDWREPGNELVINIARNSDQFHHDVYVIFGNRTYRPSSNAGTQVRWVIPREVYDQYPNSDRMQARIDVHTKLGGNNQHIGTTSKTLNMGSNADVGPDFTGVTHSEATAGVAANVGAYVQGISSLNLEIAGITTQYGATIRAAAVSVAGFTINATSGKTGIITRSGTLTISASITDTRGKFKTKEFSINVLAYDVPKMAALFQRALANGTPATEGTYLRVDLNATVSSLLVGGVQKNALTYRIMSRLRGTTAWTNKKTYTLPNSGVAFNSFDVVGTYSVEQSWEVLVEVVDDFRTSGSQGTLATAKVFMHWGNKDQGIGIGKFWERGGLDLLGQMYQNDGKAVIDEAQLATRLGVELSSVQNATKTNYWSGGVRFVPIGRVVIVQFDLTKINGNWTSSAWASDLVATGFPAPVIGQEIIEVLTNQSEYGGFSVGISGNGDFRISCRWVGRTFGQGGWAQGAFSYIKAA